MKRHFSAVRDERGQTTIEYIIIVFVVVSVFLMIVAFLNNYNLMNKLTQPLQVDFKYTYQYGKGDARGYQDPGGPFDHPRIPTGKNFRIFINPGPQQ